MKQKEEEDAANKERQREEAEVRFLCCFWLFLCVLSSNFPVQQDQIICQDRLWTKHEGRLLK